MSVALLAKVAGMSTAVSTALGSFVYYNLQDNRLAEHSAKLQFKRERISNLEEKKGELSAQLGYAQKNINFNVVCKTGEPASFKLVD